MWFDNSFTKKSFDKGLNKLQNFGKTKRKSFDSRSNVIDKVGQDCHLITFFQIKPT